MNTITLVTGGFDPLHSGHIAYFKAAKEFGNILCVGVNSAGIVGADNLLVTSGSCKAKIVMTAIAIAGPKSDIKFLIPLEV